MAATLYKDRIMELTTSTGTGPLALAGSPVGFGSFTKYPASQAGIICVIEAVDASNAPTGDWEIASCTLSADRRTLTRNTVRESSNGGAAVSFPSGNKRVYAVADGTWIETHNHSTTPLADGAVGTPSLYFANDTNTGLYRIGNDSIGIAAGGVNSLTIDTGAVRSSLALTAPSLLVKPVGNANCTATISPVGTGLYSILELQGDGSSNVKGLTIMAGQQQCWFNSDTYTFRKADGVTVMATIHPGGATVKGMVAAQTTGLSAELFTSGGTAYFRGTDGGSTLVPTAVSGLNVQLVTNFAIRAQISDTVAAFTVPVTVPGEVYGLSWNGKTDAATKNDIYDKLTTGLTAAELAANSGGGTVNFLRADGTWSGPPQLVSDAAFGAGWNGITTIAPSQNAVYDELVLRPKLAGPNTYTAGPHKFDLSGAHKVMAGGTIEGWVYLQQSNGYPEVHIRGNAGKNAVLSFTEDTIADRWAIGIKSADDALYFIGGNVLSNPETVKLGGGQAITVRGDNLGINFRNGANVLQGALNGSTSQGLNAWVGDGAFNIVSMADGLVKANVDRYGRSDFKGGSHVFGPVVGDTAADCYFTLRANNYYSWLRF